VTTRGGRPAALSPEKTTVRRLHCRLWQKLVEVLRSNDLGHRGPRERHGEEEKKTATSPMQKRKTPDERQALSTEGQRSLGFQLPELELKPFGSVLGWKKRRWRTRLHLYNPKHDDLDGNPGLLGLIRLKPSSTPARLRSKKMTTDVWAPVVSVTEEKEGAPAAPPGPAHTRESGEGVGCSASLGRPKQKREEGQEGNMPV
jgi:hypothetical protein